MFTVQANHEDIRYFYTAREAQDFARTYAKEHGVTTYVKSGGEQAPKPKEDRGAITMQMLIELQGKQRTKAGRQAVEDAMYIVAMEDS